MAVLMATGVLIVGLVAWHHRAGSVAAGQPAELPIRAELAAPTAAALAPTSSIDGEVTYVAAPGLAALEGSAHAWHLTPTQVTSATVNRLAAALGLSGSAVAGSGGWTVSGPDPRTLTVTGPAHGTMDLDDVGRGRVPAGGVPCPWPRRRSTQRRHEGHRPGSERAGGHLGRRVRGTGDHRADRRPERHVTPSGAQAEAKARAIFLSATRLRPLGLVGDQRGVVRRHPGHRPRRAWTAPPSTRPMGGSATVGVSLYFGPGAEVSSGSGSWGQPVEADAYPLIRTSAGIDALNRGRDLPGVEPMMAAPGDSSAGSVAPDTTEAATTPNLPAGPAPTPACPAIGGSGPPDAVGPCRTTTTIAAPPSTVNCGALAGRVPSCPPRCRDPRPRRSRRRPPSPRR